MKKRLIAGLLALVLAMSGAIINPNSRVTTYAETIQTDYRSKLINFSEEQMINQNDSTELSTYDEINLSTAAVDENGDILDTKEWFFVSDEVMVRDFMSPDGLSLQFYSDYEDAEKAIVNGNHTAFEGAIPPEAFGKYVYKWYGIIRETENGLELHDVPTKLIRSKYTVTDWGDTDYQTFSLNSDNKTVSLFTLCATEKASFQKRVTINGKKYSVTEIGAYAYEGGSALSSVTLHSGIKKIGESAFSGASGLKEIKIQGNITSVGKNAFKGINKKAVFKIKASSKNYKSIVKKIKKSGVPKTVKFVRVK